MARNGIFDIVALIYQQRFEMYPLASNDLFIIICIIKYVRREYGLIIVRLIEHVIFN